MISILIFGAMFSLVTHFGTMKYVETKCLSEKEFSVLQKDVSEGFNRVHYTCEKKKNN